MAMKRSRSFVRREINPVCFSAMISIVASGRMLVMIEENILRTWRLSVLRR
jgi:hypothetical protein